MIAFGTLGLQQLMNVSLQLVLWILDQKNLWWSSGPFPHMNKFPLVDGALTTKAPGVWLKEFPCELHSPFW